MFKTDLLSTTLRVCFAIDVPRGKQRILAADV